MLNFLILLTASVLPFDFHFIHYACNRPSFEHRFHIESIDTEDMQLIEVKELNSCYYAYLVNCQGYFCAFIVYVNEDNLSPSRYTIYPCGFQLAKMFFHNLSWDEYI